jgi:hypothetical protein
MGTFATEELHTVCMILRDRLVLEGNSSFCISHCLSKG